MDRRTFIKQAALASGVAASATTLATPSIARSTPEVRWRLASSWPKSLATLFGAAELFTRTVFEATDGRFQIQLFAADEIVPPLEVVDAVSSNTIEMCHTASYYYWGKDPTFAFGTAVPFGLNSRMMNAWLYEAGGNDLLNAFYAKFDLYGLPAGNTGAQMGGWYRREINTVADFDGLKMRIGGMAGAVMAKLGVVTVQTGGLETYQALERGTIDAIEWVGPSDDEKLGFAKVAKYYYYPGWWEGGAMTHYFVNGDRWNELPKSYQAVATAAAARSNVSMQASYDALNPPALRRLIAQGALLRTFSPEILARCFEVANEVFAEKSAENADFKQVYESMKAFRNEAYLWNQVTDGTFDNFMMDQQRAGAL